MSTISLARILGSIVLCCAVSVDVGATLRLGVTFENVHGGGGGTTVIDENELTASLPTGRGSASLAALRSFNESDSSSNTAYFNRSSWALDGVVFSGDVPGASTATVGLGGQLTASMVGRSAAGLFKGASAIVAVDYSAFWFDRDGFTHFPRGNLFTERVSVGGLDPVLDFSVFIDEFVGTTLTVPVDIPINFSMTLMTLASYTTVSPGDGGYARTDASNTLQFDPDNFFDIQTPGITANAGPFLVNNRLPAFSSSSDVPAPPAVALMLPALIAMPRARRAASAGSIN